MAAAPLFAHRRLRIALGTWVAIEATSPSSRQADAAIAAAFRAILEVERRMHPTGKDSDLARINTAATPPAPSALQDNGSRGTVIIHHSTWELLELAKRLYEITDGIFDPCLPERPGRLCDVEMLPQRKVRCHAPVSLDFGGFAKGYAVDRAVDALVRHGCSSGLVNAGGDLRVFGPGAQVILVREPNGTLRPLELKSAAVAVSAINNDHRPAEHRGYYRRTAGVLGTPAPRARNALPASRERAPNPTQAVVVAAEAVTADALTKCVLLSEATVAARALRVLGGVDYSDGSVARLAS